MGGTMLLADTDVLPVRDRITFPEARRKYPLQLVSRSLEETMRMKLPEGFEVEEMPPPTQWTTAFGEHSSSCQAAGGYVTCRRSLTVKTAVVPLDGYPEARAFFALARGDRHAPLVLSGKQRGSAP
jgi:hypothetical protein